MWHHGQMHHRVRRSSRREREPEIEGSKQQRTTPEARPSLNCGVPFYALGGKMMCALAAHEAHVNRILSGPPEPFDDAEGLLSGDSRLGRHLNLTRLDQPPRVRAWLETAKELALKGIP